MRNMVQTIGVVIMAFVAILLPIILGLIMQTTMDVDDKAVLLLCTTTVSTFAAAFGGWLTAEAYHRIKD